MLLKCPKRSRVAGRVIDGLAAFCAFLHSCSAPADMTSLRLDAPGCYNRVSAEWGHMSSRAINIFVARRQAQKGESAFLPQPDVSLAFGGCRRLPCTDFTSRPGLGTSVRQLSDCLVRSTYLLVISERKHFWAPSCSMQHVPRPSSLNYYTVT